MAIDISQLEDITRRTDDALFNTGDPQRQQRVLRENLLEYVRVSLNITEALTELVQRRALSELAAARAAVGKDVTAEELGYASGYANGLTDALALLVGKENL